MNRNVLGAIYAVAVLGLGYYLWGNIIWSNKGYAPAQPIPFSHKIHAGDNHIPCLYCHTNVERSPHATIPSLNICMNCHSVVAVDKPNIVKLTEAYNAGRTIEWVRVHNLPDHAYFSHQHHIAKGFDCAECHGDVASMDVVHQSQRLRMGDCVTCHRQNEGPTSCNACHQ